MSACWRRWGVSSATGYHAREVVSGKVLLVLACAAQAIEIRRR
jgi:hypothetical protein